MKIRLLLASFVGLVILFVSCSAPNTVSLVETNFGKEVKQKQNFVFTFNKDLAPEQQLNLWDSTEYVTFNPPIPGSFRWISSKELLFSPSTKLRNSTEYSAQVTDKITRFLDKKQESVALNVEKIAFNTPLLKLVSSKTIWSSSPNISTKGFVKASLTFNYPVNPNEISQKISVTSGGASVPFQLLSTTIDNTILLAITADSFTENNFEFSIQEGVKAHESTTISKEKFVAQTSISRKSDLEILAVEGSFDGINGQINIKTSQSISPEILLPAVVGNVIAIDPMVKFTAKQTEDGVAILGDFQPGLDYYLSINDTLFKGILGGKLSEKYFKTISFGAIPSTIQFVNSSSGYLSRKGAKNIATRIVNVPKAKLTISKIYENNIIHFMRDAQKYQYTEEGMIENMGDFGYIDATDYGDVISEKTFETSTLPQAGNGISLLNFDINDFTEMKGMYVVRLQSQDDLWQRSTQIVSLSDVGLIAKQGENSLTVFANSLNTAEPLVGITIKVFSTSNQELFTAKTDAKGIASFNNLQARGTYFKPGMVTARSENDFTFLLLNSRMKVETARYETNGLSGNASGLIAYIYGDRNIYRPGETYHSNVIIRNEQHQVVPNIPVILKFIDPNGKEFSSYKKTLNNFGATETNIPLPSSMRTGTYTVEVYSSNEVLLASEPISVEEFLPDRIKVTPSLSSTEVMPGKPIQVKASVMNFYGTPAANRPYEVSISFRKSSFKPKFYADYDFSINNDNSVYYENAFKNGLTKSDGTFAEDFTIAKEYSDVGVLQGKAYITVFDETSRPVNRLETFQVLTQDAFFGIKKFDRYISTNTKFPVPIIALDKNGATLNNVQATVQIVRKRWNTVMERGYDEGYRYVSQIKEDILFEKTMSISGTGTSIPVNAVQSGDYEIRIKRPGASRYAYYSFYAYNYGTTDLSSFEVNKEGQVSIVSDKESYSVGETANLLFKTPFKGKLLVTVERNNILENFVLQTDNRAATLALPIKDGFAPNVYISTTLIKPHQESDIPLTVAHGYHNINVTQTTYKMNVEVEAPKNSRANTMQTVTLKAKPNSEVTVAIVDEGVLQVKNFVSPNPFDFFFQKRALTVESFDMYKFLYPEFSVGKISFGGGDGDFAKRVNPITNRRVNLVTFWSGVLKTDESGKATYSFKVPQFSGTLRVMAVAYNDKTMGGAEASIVVADPLVLSTALPRFLSPKDTFNLPVIVTNTTSENKNVTVKVATQGPLKVLSASSNAISIDGKAEKVAMFQCISTDEIGEASLQVIVSSGSDTYTDSLNIAVRPASSLQKISGNGVIAGGNTESFEMVAPYVKGTEERKLLVSNSPIAQFCKDLSMLVSYPYGCLEQTISTGFAQMYFADLSRALKSTKLVSSNPTENVQEAIRKVESMQSYSGGFYYWQGGTSEHWWSTVYACQFLLEAEKAGFQVNRMVLDKALDHLSRRLKISTLVEYRFTNASTVKKGEYIPREVAYSLYILALDQKREVSTMNYLKSNKNLLTDDSKYLLAVTYKLLGDNANYTEMLPTKFSDNIPVQEFAGSFSSFVRDQAVALSCLVDVDPANQQVVELVRHLSEQMKKAQYLHTQEVSFALMALGKYARSTGESSMTATIEIDGKKVAEYTSGQDLILKNGLENSKMVKISTSGKGQLYYSWETSGIGTSPSKDVDSYLQARKSFFSRNGSAVALNSIKQNDLIVIRYSIVTNDKSVVNNVVLTDLLPAGLEIENPRVSAVQGLDWIKDAAQMDNMDIRDDRVSFFVTADGKVKNIYILCRAVSKGNFTMGPVMADAMYNGNYRSYNGAGRLSIQ
jgi:uncharacterized protein YfaS (alpha-2-macroglobulin family)